MKKIMIYLIKFYQNYISKYILVGSHCRFYPTCSEYSLLAYQKYGFFKASYLSIKRILKCNPFHEGGYDPLK
ncbi:membrane protein insertion efficiency factor YidD [Soehngenia longivitae]|nr:membrane protein insertion efficiency factor YidD [Soehngenia longivitae]